MNIYEISELAGVSIATVSRVLNNSPRVKPETRAKIEKIINDNRYSPTRTGKKKLPPKTVGVLCNSIRNPRSASLIENLLTHLHNLNYDTLLVNCKDDLAEKKIAIQRFTDIGVRAIIIEGTDFLSYNQADNAYLLHAADSTPIILLNSYLEHSNIYSILCDEGGLIFNITEEYIKHNRTNIVLLFSSMSAYCTPLIEAFSHAFYVHNLETTPHQLQLCSKDFDEAYKYINNLLKSGTAIDAVIATDDIMAVGAKKAARDNGLIIPDDIEIYGMGNTFIADISNLSSINCKEKEVSNAAINTISGILNKTHTPTRVTFPAELIKRGTNR